MPIEPDIRKELPKGRGHKTETPNYSLRVDGLVGQNLDLKKTDLESLPHHSLTSDFTCVEGWTVPDVKWRGIKLVDVLAIAKPLSQARHVQASAGEFSISLSWDLAERALLATGLDDGDLTAEHGGPVRLIVPGGECFTSIKWLDHLELRAEPGPNTAKAIALARLPSGACDH